MSHRGTRSTAALLQKANTQLRGERVISHTEEDDLNAYINSLTKRTSPKKSINLDEDSDISISNEDYQYGGSTLPAPVPVSKFLKKKTVQNSLDSVNSLGPQDDKQQNTFFKKTPAPTPAGRSPLYPGGGKTASGYGRPQTAPSSQKGQLASHGPGQQRLQSSVTLNKAAALTNKISNRHAAVPIRQGKVFTMDTDSDDSFMAAGRRVVPRRSPSPLRTASESSISVGRDGGKFVKKKAEAPPPPTFLTDKKLQSREQSSKHMPKTGGSLAAGLKSAQRYSAKAMLSSEEESLAEFIEGLSGSDKSLRQPKVKKSTKTLAHSKPIKRTQSPDSKPPLVRTPSPKTPRQMTPSPRQSPFKRTPSPPNLQSRLLARTISEESFPSEDEQRTAVTESATDIPEDFRVNVMMDIDTLEPVLSFDDHSTHETKRYLDSPSPSPFYKTSHPRESSPEDKQTSKKTSSKNQSKSSGIDTQNHSKKAKPKPNIVEKLDIFSSFGLHSVDELPGGESKESSKEISVASEISEIHTEKSENIFAVKKRANDSVAEILSEIQSKQTGNNRQDSVSYSEDFNTITERIGEDSLEKDVPESLSEVKTVYSDESKHNTVNAYTEDFNSDTDDDERGYGDSYSSDSDSRTYSDTQRSTSSSPVPMSANAKEKKSVEVQTGDQIGLTYHWNSIHSGMAFMGPSYGMSFVDPSPIAAHTVSADSLEAMTSYSPAMIALHDMLKQQLELTQSFVQAQKYLYDSYTHAIEPCHKYTTLEDTKEYIRRHRKPRLTFREALKLVDQEMS